MIRYNKSSKNVLSLLIIQFKEGTKEWTPDGIGFFNLEHEESGPMAISREQVFYSDTFTLIDFETWLE